MGNLKRYGLTFGLMVSLAAVACSDDGSLTKTDPHPDTDAGDVESDAGGGNDAESELDATIADAGVEDGGTSDTGADDGSVGDAGNPDAASDAGQVSSAVAELGADLVYDSSELEPDLWLPAEAELPQDLLPPK